MGNFKELSFKNRIRTYNINGDYARITLGKRSYCDEIFVRCEQQNEHIFIGNYCSVARDVVFGTGGNHHYDFLTSFPIGLMFGYKRDANSCDFKNVKKNLNKNFIFVGNDVWIGHGATILDGVTIGNGAIIGAQSVVTKDVPPYAIVGGNPAKIIRYRFSEELSAKLNKIKWWYWNEEQIQTNKEFFRTTNIQEFIDKYYSPAMDYRLDNEFSYQLQAKRAEGYEIVYYEPDFTDHSTKYGDQSLNERVLEQFFELSIKKKIMLIIVMPTAEFQQGAQELQKIYNQNVNKYGIKANIVAKAVDGVPVHILQNIDYVILNHKESMLPVVDISKDYGAKILSAFALYIFDN